MNDQGAADSKKQATEATSTSRPSTEAATSSTQSTSAAGITHEETVGRPVSKSELSPEVRARIERNRQAALERRAKYEQRLKSERAIAWEFDGVGSSSSSGGQDGQLSTADVVEKNAQLIHKIVADLEPLPKNEWTKFYDYDLTNMKDSRAGFIQELDKKDATIGSNAEGEENTKKRKWEPTIQQPDPCE